LRRRIFSSLRKALHCNCGTFSIVDRLYFSGKIFFRRRGPFPSVRSTRKGRTKILPRLNPCRFPVNHLYLQGRQNLT
jgi:hypothetical protein